MLTFSPKEIYMLAALYSMPSFPSSTKHYFSKMLYKSCSETNSWSSCKNFTEKLIEMEILKVGDNITYSIDRVSFEDIWKRTPYFRLSFEIMVNAIENGGILWWGREKIRKLIFNNVDGVYK